MRRSGHLLSEQQEHAGAPLNNDEEFDGNWANSYLNQLKNAAEIAFLTMKQTKANAFFKKRRIRIGRPY